MNAFTNNRRTPYGYAEADGIVLASECREHSISATSNRRGRGADAQRKTQVIHEMEVDIRFFTVVHGSNLGQP